MILVDTTVWIDHLRATEPCLVKNLRAGLVLMHPMIVGEVACGNLPKRLETLRKMRSLPGIANLNHELVCSRIETLRLNGRGIGFVDAHLICSVLEYDGARLWTRDKRLKEVADDYGVDVFHPNTGEVRSDGVDGIACWFIDTDYNEESFFVRHAYFLGAGDPYKALKTTLKSEIDAEA